MKNRLIAVIGPTAVGKTKISIDLAERLHSEIISGDSMLVYRGMDIGTAKPDTEERKNVPHHLIDILDPCADYSVADFKQHAATLISQINLQGKIPILAGGTGLYVKALLEGYEFNAVGGDAVIRQYFSDLLIRHGSEYLHKHLQERDPAAAARLHPNDTRRIIRALEVNYLADETVSQTNALSQGLQYDALVIGLSMDRQKLYERINLRVELMVKAGLFEEVAGLLAAGVTTECQSMQGIGYKEAAACLAGQYSREEAIFQIQQATRHFAKRQLTWYRKMPYIAWIDLDQFSDYGHSLEYIYSLVAGKFYLE